jgi:hypothetical protein
MRHRLLQESSAPFSAFVTMMAQLAAIPTWTLCQRGRDCAVPVILVGVVMLPRALANMMRFLTDVTMSGPSFSCRISILLHL